MAAKNIQKKKEVRMRVTTSLTTPGGTHGCRGYRVTDIPALVDLARIRAKRGLSFSYRK